MTLTQLKNKHTNKSISYMGTTENAHHEKVIVAIFSSHNYNKHWYSFSYNGKIWSDLTN